MRISDWSSDVCSSDLVPGGLGVFEATLLLAYSGSLPVDRLAGALVLYRGIYYLLPLLVAIAMLAIFELRVGVAAPLTRVAARLSRSEEHTSELKSLMRISYAVFCLKKKKTQKLYRLKL